jgi:hypothetical protein
VQDADFEKQRRASFVLGDAKGVVAMMPTSALHSLSLYNLLTPAQTRQLAKSFIECVKISFDIVKDIDTWFDKVMPCASSADDEVLFDNLKGILQQIGKIIRPCVPPLPAHPPPTNSPLHSAS